MTRTRLIAAASLAAALALTACSGPSDGPVVTTPPTGAAPESPTVAPSTPASEQPSADPTCETIIPASTVDDFAELGWTANATSFRAGSIELDGGVQCTWGDFDIATDHVQLFGWAPIDQATTDEAVDELLAAGWRREETEVGVYVTESSETAIATDADGYGLTYLFTAGAVKMADTKQGLLLVEWPPA